MNKTLARGHLTFKEISEALVEDLQAPAAAHLQGCRQCQASLVEARRPLDLFRDTVVAWGDSRQAAHPRPASQQNAADPSRWSISRWVPAAGMAFAATLLIAVMIGTGTIHKPFALKQPIAAPVSDAMLLEQVDAEVSEAVPDAMSPLTDLVAWDSTGSAENSTAIKGQAVSKKLQEGLDSKTNKND